MAENEALQKLADAGPEAEKHSATAPDLPPKRNAGRPKGAKNGIHTKATRFLDLALKNVPPSEISKAIDVPVRTVKDHLAKFRKKFKELGAVKEYEASKQQLLSATELRMLKSLNDESKHKKASLSSVAFAFEKLHQAGRLERNQSTKNLAVSFAGIPSKTDK